MNTADLPLSEYARTSLLETDGPEWLQTLRHNGFVEYERQGIPGKRVERWKYTSSRPVTQTNWVPISNVPLHRMDVCDLVKAIEQSALTLEGQVLVLVNGCYDSEVTQCLQEKIGRFALNEGVLVTSLREVTQQAPDSLNGLLGSLLPIAEHPFAALNTCLVSDGLVIRVADGVHASCPLHVISVTCGGDAPFVIQPRLVIDMASDSTMSVVESHISVDEKPVFTNWVREMRLADHARLNHSVIQDVNTESIWIMGSQAVLGCESVLNDFSFIRGAALSRADLCVSFSGEGAHAHVHGAYVIGRDQHSDTTTFVDHAVPRCSSSQTWKGILDGNGSGVFQGKVLVQRAAQQTDGQQLHKALMLSKGAEVNTKPELMIYADDVKCSHGAATGALDEEALFYLKARGIKDEVARALLIEGFLEEVFGLIPGEDVRHAVQERVQAWLVARAS